MRRIRSWAWTVVAQCCCLLTITTRPMPAVVDRRSQHARKDDGSRDGDRKKQYQRQKIKVWYPTELNGPMARAVTGKLLGLWQLGWRPRLFVRLLSRGLRSAEAAPAIRLMNGKVAAGAPPEIHPWFLGPSPAMEGALSRSRPGTITKDTPAARYFMKIKTLLATRT